MADNGLIRIDSLDRGRQAQELLLRQHHGGRAAHGGLVGLDLGEAGGLASEIAFQAGAESQAASGGRWICDADMSECRTMSAVVDIDRSASHQETTERSNGADGE
jgi:hypothetical protein